jgi:hypothetical protein
MSQRCWGTDAQPYLWQVDQFGIRLRSVGHVRDIHYNGDLRPGQRKPRMHEQPVNTSSSPMRPG